MGLSLTIDPWTCFIQAENTNLTWETTTQTDVSLQFGLLDEAITGEIGYFVKETNDLLFAEPIQHHLVPVRSLKISVLLKTLGLNFNYQPQISTAIISNGQQI